MNLAWFLIICLYMWINMYFIFSIFIIYLIEKDVLYSAYQIVQGCGVIMYHVHNSIQATGLNYKSNLPKQNPKLKTTVGRKRRTNALYIRLTATCRCLNGAEPLLGSQSSFGWSSRHCSGLHIEIVRSLTVYRSKHDGEVESWPFLSTLRTRNVFITALQSLMVQRISDRNTPSIDPLPRYLLLITQAQ